MSQAKEFREKEEKELRKVLAEIQAEISELRGKRAIGALADTSLIRKKRRDVAKIVTVLGEKDVLKEISAAEKQEDHGKKEA